MKEAMKHNIQKIQFEKMKEVWEEQVDTVSKTLDNITLNQMDCAIEERGETCQKNELALEIYQQKAEGSG